MWRGAGSGMTRRTASWIAWLACGLVVAASAGSVALRSAEGARSPSIQTFSLLLSLAFPVIGAVIATRRPGNWIGWIFVAVGVSFAVATLSSEYASYALITRRGAVPFGAFAARTAMSEPSWRGSRSRGRCWWWG